MSTDKPRRKEALCEASMALACVSMAGRLREGDRGKEDPSRLASFSPQIASFLTRFEADKLGRESDLQIRTSRIEAFPEKATLRPS